MSGVVADTHALLWYFADAPGLSAAARERFDRALANGGSIHIPSICLVELTYLVEKGRVAAEALPDLRRRLDTADSGVVLADLDRSVADTIARIPRERVPDMPDRIIAATALHLGLPLVSRDRRIQASGIDVVW